jgi:streptomycin 6-kinase
VEERVGALALRHFAGRGAVRLLRSDADAQLLEYADGNDLTGLVQNGQDEAATALIGDVINALHADASPPPEGITPLTQWFRALFVQAETERAKGKDSIFVRAAAVAEPVLADPRDLRVLHGDIHHENIRQSPRGWLAFDPKGLYGERAYDLANTLCNPRAIYGVETADEARVLRNSAILAERCGIDQRRVLLFLYLYACLSASWTLQDAGEGIANVLEVAAIAERHL